MLEGPLTWLNSKNKDKVWAWLLTDVMLIGNYYLFLYLDDKLLMTGTSRKAKEA